MIVQGPEASRSLHCQRIEADLIVVGGGFAGSCTAITAARRGLRVALVQDRPVLGGNASSEVRLWVLGATAHLTAPNRWAREGGVVDELHVENLYRNPDGNPLIWDTVLLEKVVEEKNIHLLLNTAVFEVSKDESNPDRIRGVRGFCSQNSTMYELAAPLFVDASGDGIVGFLAGAAFRMGAESAAEFGEKFAPAKSYGELLGHSIYFYSKDVGAPVRYVPPSFALKDIEKAVPRYRGFNAGEFGCRLWWIEYGGRLDTVHDTERIKWELWRVVYGVWDYIKNSGKFPEAANLTLEWVGTIPGKRESRRFEGDYMLTQRDLIEQRPHDDAVSFGGWAIDLHPADGVYSDLHGCTHWRPKGVYAIPYRCLYSRNIRNLFLTGRLISASHVAFGSTRVMATGAHSGQAVAVAAEHCLARNCEPRDLLQRDALRTLRRDLLRTGQYIPGVARRDEEDLAQAARVTASSAFALTRLPLAADGAAVDAGRTWAQLVPMGPGRVPRATLWLRAKEAMQACVQLRVSSKPMNQSIDVVLSEQRVSLTASQHWQEITIDFAVELHDWQYVGLCVQRDDRLEVASSDRRATGLLSLRHLYSQDPWADPALMDAQVIGPDGRMDIGVEKFEVFAATRRPGGRNLALRLEPGVNAGLDAAFTAENVVDGVCRPVERVHAWVASPDDPQPTLTLTWPRPVTIRRVVLSFDCDWDHPMETVLMGHPERTIPFCVADYDLLDHAGSVLLTVRDNHLTRNELTLPAPARTGALVLRIHRTQGNQIPAAVFEVQVWS